MENHSPFFIDNICVACFSKGDFPDLVIHRCDQVHDIYCADNFVIIIHRSSRYNDDIAVEAVNDGFPYKDTAL